MCQSPQFGNPTSPSRMPGAMGNKMGAWPPSSPPPAPPYYPPPNVTDQTYNRRDMGALGPIGNRMGSYPSPATRDLQDLSNQPGGRAYNGPGMRTPDLQVPPGTNPFAPQGDQSGGMPQTGGEQIYNAPPPQNTTPQTGGDFTISAPPPQNMTLPPMSGGIQAKPAMIPGTNRPMPPGAFIDEYGIARRAPETPFNPGAGQFGQYGQRPAGGFQGSVRNGQNFIGNTLFAPQGLNQNGKAPDANMMNFVNYMNSYRR